MAQDPPLGLAILHGPSEWETARVVSDSWITTHHFRRDEWTRIQEVGYTGVPAGYLSLGGLLGRVP